MSQSANDVEPKDLPASDSKEYATRSFRLCVFVLTYTVRGWLLLLSGQVLAYFTNPEHTHKYYMNVMARPNDQKLKHLNSHFRSWTLEHFPFCHSQCNTIYIYFLYACKSSSIVDRMSRIRHDTYYKANVADVAYTVSVLI